ncbi:HET-domain-containing protein [Rostrohypoxylon terebratum]|nr:HET-domain-containing protein [Rostrohypoxylon terebratum]
MSTDITLNPFCKRCNVVLFDDSTIGGQIVQGDDSEEFLKIGDDDAKQLIPIDFELRDPYPNLPLLSKSAEAGCKFCIFLKKLVVEPPGPRVALSKPGVDIDGVSEIRIYMQYMWQASARTLPKARGLQGLRIIIHGYNTDEEIICQATVLCRIESVPGPCASWLRLGLDRSSDVLGPDTTTWIQHMLDSTALPLMKIQAGIDFVPTRLVHVDCRPPRLIESSDELGRGYTRHSLQYAALTYCWGSPEQARSQLKTTRSSLLSRLSSIEEHDMTKVLEDAVRTCRALFIPYLWIAALCIIQDDPQDWEQESASMGKIFGNAYLTICAAASSSCNEDFLNRRLGDIEIPFLSKMRPGIDGSYSLRALPSLLFDEIRDTFINSTWAQRAWTYQEKATSVRILAFGRPKIHFISPWKTQTQDEVAIDDSYIFQITRLEYANDLDFKHLWETVVSAYSERVLTYETDRFPALSGIAQRFSALTGDEYVAGMWKRGLFLDLFWNCIPATTRTWDALINQSGDITRYVAPSWSWARYHSYMEFSLLGNGTTIFVPHERNCQREYQSVNTDITLNGVDPFGQIKTASMRITTRTRPLPSDIDVVDNSSTEPRREVMMVLLGSGIDSRTSPSPSTDSSLNTDEVTDEDDTESSEDATWAFGLLIHPVPNTDKYCRVGIFCSEPSHRWRTRLFDDCPERTVVLI